MGAAWGCVIARAKRMTTPGCCTVLAQRIRTRFACALPSLVASFLPPAESKATDESTYARNEWQGGGGYEPEDQEKYRHDQGREEDDFRDEPVITYFINS